MKISTIISCLFALFAATPTVVGGEAARPIFQEFFVSPQGDDANPGSKQRPFQTLARAKAAVRVIIPAMTGDIIVTLAGGTYPIRETVVFAPEDSAQKDNQIIYRAAAGEKPLLSGGLPVLGWERHNDTMWKAPLKRDVKLRALYVNGQRAVMAKTVKKVTAQGGWGTYTVTAGQAPWAWQSGTVADGVKYKLADLPDITRNPTDVEIENQTTWNKNFIGVREIIKEGEFHVFKFQQPYGAIAQRIGWNAGLILKYGQIVHNAFELLDQPGEFYFDRAGQTVYYIPRPGEDMATASVVVPVTETLLQFAGQPITRRVRNLAFEGITFAYTDYNLLEIDGSHGKATVQTACVNTAFANSNWHFDAYRAYDVLPGAIVANGVENLSFTRNTIEHTGCEGLVASNDINDLRIVGNVISDTGGSAISIGHPQHVYENDTADLKYATGAGIEHEKFPAGTESVPRNVLIANNFLPEDAALFNGHTVITVFFGDGIKIVHNWIPSAPYSGMNLGWGWCDFDGSEVGKHPQWGNGQRPAVIPGKPTMVTKNNLISANKVENTMSILHDGGGIYTLGSQPGTIIERNYVRRSEQAIYTDEGSAQITCRENVIEEPFKNAHFAPNFGRKHSVTVAGYFATKDKYEVTAPSCTVTDFTVCPNAQWPEKAKQIIAESGLEPAFRDIVPADWKSKEVPVITPPKADK